MFFYKEKKLTAINLEFPSRLFGNTEFLLALFGASGFKEYVKLRLGIDVFNKRNDEVSTPYEAFMRCFGAQPIRKSEGELPSIIRGFSGEYYAIEGAAKRIEKSELYKACVAELNKKLASGEGDGSQERNDDRPEAEKLAEMIISL